MIVPPPETHRQAISRFIRLFHVHPLVDYKGSPENFRIPVRLELSLKLQVIDNNKCLLDELIHFYEIASGPISFQFVVYVLLLHVATQDVEDAFGGRLLRRLGGRGRTRRGRGLVAGGIGVSSNAPLIGIGTLGIATSIHARAIHPGL